MTAIDTVLFALITGALVFSIIVLGLDAYIMSYWSSHYYTYYSYYSDYTYRYVTPAVNSYLIFCAIIGILVSIALIVLRHTKGPRMGEKTFGWISVTVITITAIFWLAGFADLASWLGVFTYVGGAWQALLAFAILTWLCFTALAVFSFLTAFGVVRSERRGFHPFMRKSTVNNQGAVPMTTSHYGPTEAAKV